MISIIVPTYNERENVKAVIKKLARALHGCEYEIIVVDDNSPDGTADVVEKLARKYPVRVLRRRRRLGLASAVVYGFRYARGEILGVIDADLQHTPELVKKLVDATRINHDLVIASRYVNGAKIVEWPLYRWIISKVAIFLARPLTHVRDPVSGYFFLKRSVIDGVKLDSVGYKILLEILVKGKYNRVLEIPYTFRGRTKGRSKLSIDMYFKYLNLLLRLYFHKIASKWRFT